VMPRSRSSSRLASSTSWWAS